MAARGDWREEYGPATVPRQYESCDPNSEFDSECIVSLMLEITRFD